MENLFSDIRSLLDTPLALMATIIQIGWLVWSNPALILTLYRERKADQHPISFHLWPTGASVFWTLHAYLERPNILLLLACGIGAIFGVVITGQVIYYNVILPRRRRIANQEELKRSVQSLRKMLDPSVLS